VHERGEVGVARKDLADAQVFQVFLVFGQSRSDNPRAGVGCELDGEAADASGRTDGQDGYSFGERERVDGRECGDAGEWGDAGRGEVERGGFSPRPASPG
jgi:hypothetical protein